MELSTQMNVYEELLVPTKQETTDNNINSLSFNGGFDHHHHHHHHQFFPNGYSIDYLCFNNEEEDENTLIYPSSFMDLISQPPPLLLHQPPPLQPPSPPLSSSAAATFDYPFLEALQEIIDSSSSSPPLILQNGHQEDNNNNFHNPTSSYPSPLMESDQSKSFSVGYCGGETNKKKSKKLEGQPSKNLMAERRRRKRLNDRLSMLRSIVPKISKMDRTSILGDAIDYMKELLDKINKLQDEEQELGNSNNSHHSKLFGDLKDLNTNEPMVRNSPKFEIDRRDEDTRVDICCSPKPGLLLSTVNTLETLGMEIEQCVISCFSDFSLQASCSEGAEQRDFITSEDIKQALFRNAGYGGSCL
ncbi:PREDICTED: transcription factor bHLH93 [Camelina sativa]|uniref:Transcription factor bHLH93 n=1 Tax=Camelina sativa TaxID=90675 RepID=A0ABM0XDR0_CAMSA|nr:PREDICTED: transcription factor bHLH93 [Camelina sativa]